MTEAVARPTLAEAAFGETFANRMVRNVFLAVAGSILLTISAKINVPFYPVPVTMQTLAVLVIGMAFGWRLGSATVILYLAQGAMGLPVFAGTPEKGIGLAYMAGPTGGYLVGFVLAAALVGYLAERGWDRSYLMTGIAQFLGTVMLFVPGLVWLGILFGWDQPILEWGFYPFIYGAILKIALGTALMPSLWKLVHRLRG